MARLTFNFEAWVPVGVVLLLVLVSTWLWKVVENNAPPSARLVHHDPDLIMHHFNARQLDEKGVLHYTLNASKMVHYPDDDTSHFQQVLFTSYEPASPPLSIQSDTAIRWEKQDKVVFSGHVVVIRQATATEPMTIMNTTLLTVYPQQGLGETDRPVVGHYGRDLLTAQGMTLNNKTRIAEFPRAKIIYHPASTHP